MIRAIRFLALISVMILSSCSRQESAEAPTSGDPATQPGAETPTANQVVGGPHAFVHLKSGGSVPGAVVASSKTDIVVAGDDGIEHKIPLSQVKSVEYGDAPSSRAAAPRSRETAQPPRRAPETSARQEPPARQATEPVAPLTPMPPPVTTKTYQLPAGSEISVRTDEPIDSETATEGQTFSAQVTRNATDASGDIVIPRGSKARVVIRSASQGGRIRGASDLVLDLQSVAINGKEYTIDTADVTKKGKAGVGANRRTAEYTGGGAALGAIIGAIAGGGKGAAIGAGAGAGAGAIAQILTKGKAIKVPAESVLTFRLDQPLKVNAAE